MSHKQQISYSHHKCIFLNVPSLDVGTAQHKHIHTHPKISNWFLLFSLVPIFFVMCNVFIIKSTAQTKFNWSHTYTLFFICTNLYDFDMFQLRFRNSFVIQFSSDSPKWWNGFDDCGQIINALHTPFYFAHKPKRIYPFCDKMRAIDQTIVLFNWLSQVRTCEWAWNQSENSINKTKTNVRFYFLG